MASLSTFSNAAARSFVRARVVGPPPVLDNLPPFPPVAARLMSMLARESVSFREAADVIETDAALSAKVLQLANSPLISARFGASTILQALSLVGVDRIAGVVLTLSLSAFLRRAGSGDAVRRCWRHNLACALAAKHFAATFDIEPDEAYTAGLLHDVGRLALIVKRPREYERLLATEGDIRRKEVEQFGIDHCAAGAWLIGKWNLPARYAEVALHHHDATRQVSNLTAMVNVACEIASQIGFGVSGSHHNASEVLFTDDLAYSIASTINSLECEYGMCVA